MIKGVNRGLYWTSILFVGVAVGHSVLAEFKGLESASLWTGCGTGLATVLLLVLSFYGWSKLYIAEAATAAKNMVTAALLFVGVISLCMVGAYVLAFYVELEVDSSSFSIGYVASFIALFFVSKVFLSRINFDNSTSE